MRSRVANYVTRKLKGPPYRYLNTRDAREFPSGGCRHAIRRWVYSDNHTTSRGVLGFVTACAGVAGHEGQHKTPDGYHW